MITKVFKPIARPEPVLDGILLTLTIEQAVAIYALLNENLTFDGASSLQESSAAISVRQAFRSQRLTSLHSFMGNTSVTEFTNAYADYIAAIARD